MKQISKILNKKLVRGMPNLKYKKTELYNACTLGKQVRSSFKSIHHVCIDCALQLLHMDLFGPTRTQSIGGKKYCLVIVDDFTRFTWVFFLAHKSETFSYFSKFAKRVQNEKGYTIFTLKLIMGENLKIKIFLIYVMKMVFNILFPHPILLNKME